MSDPVTARYAEALFNLAKENGALDAVRKDVERLAAGLASPAVSSFFFDARLSVETRRDKLGSLLSGLHELTRNFVGLLFDKRREEVLRGLGAAFRRLVLEETGAAEGIVQSARPLDAAEIAQLERSLGNRLGKRVTLVNETVPDLIGGVRVIVGSRMIDFSLLGRLEGLRRAMLDAPLPTLLEA